VDAYRRNSSAEQNLLPRARWSALSFALVAAIVLAVTRFLFAVWRGEPLVGEPSIALVIAVVLVLDRLSVSRQR
jgi:hypothetical protein